MPDESGAFRGIVVGRVWPGHRDWVPRSCKVEVDAIPCFSGCACTCGTDFPVLCECHPDNKESE